MVKSYILKKSRRILSFTIKIFPITTGSITLISQSPMPDIKIPLIFPENALIINTVHEPLTIPSVAAKDGVKVISR